MAEAMVYKEKRSGLTVLKVIAHNCLALLLWAFVKKRQSRGGEEKTWFSVSFATPPPLPCKTSPPQSHTTFQELHLED